VPSETDSPHFRAFADCSAFYRCITNKNGLTPNDSFLSSEADIFPIFVLLCGDHLITIVIVFFNKYTDTKAKKEKGSLFSFFCIHSFILKYTFYLHVDYKFKIKYITPKTPVSIFCSLAIILFASQSFHMLTIRRCRKCILQLFCNSFLSINISEK